MVDKLEHFNIYIKSSLHGPAKRSAAGMWLIEHEKEPGVIETKDGILYREMIKENELVLQCLINAFFVLNRTGVKTASVGVFTECEHVLNTMKNHWLPMWKKNSWRNAKGKMVSNMLLWSRLDELMWYYTVSFSGEAHSYSDYMARKVSKRLAEQ